MSHQDEMKYDSIKNDVNPFTTFKEEHDFEDYKNEDSPMIHVVPDSNKLRWNHIEDLDSFFTRMYSYHQKHGFLIIMLDEILQQCAFLFVVWIIVFTTHCVNYPVLFGNVNKNKVYLNDVIYSYDKCYQFGMITTFFLIIALIFFIFRFVKILYHAGQYWDIKKFYNSALKIEDDELDNLTWHEIQKKIREVQAEQQMCIHKDNLTELDIYHRILRFKNYMVALMNKNLLPTRYSLPIYGEVVSLSRGLLYNIEFILFRGPWSLFENNWQLRGDLAIRSNRLEYSRKLSKQIVILALFNLACSPVILVWQIIDFAFSYATLVRKEPGFLGTRMWSNYGRLCLRHFNELDHELDARLNRAYEPANKYMSSFSSPLVTVFARHILFVCGGLLLVIVSLGIYEEFVFQVEHVLTIITILSGVGVICRILLPNENLVWCPEQLLTAVLAHVHYLPTSWKNFAHTTLVRKEFEYYFQYKSMYLLNEILSPITTPFILLFIFRPRALDIVDFFRSFTVSVVGVGNVCSFAQMDIRKHGNPEWQLASSSDYNISNAIDVNNEQQHDAINRGENGKTELSLVHFTLTNPEWKMPPESKQFMINIKQQALLDLKGLEIETKTKSAMDVSLMSFGSIGEKYTSIANSVFQNKNLSIHGLADSIVFQRQPLSSIDLAQPSTSFPLRQQLQQQQITSRTAGADFEKMLHQNLSDGTSLFRPLESIEESQIDNETAQDVQNLGQYDKKTKRIRRGLRHNEGSLDGSKEGLLYSLYAFHPELSTVRTDLTTADMCLSTLYLHELHHRQMQRKCHRLAQNQSTLWQKSQIGTKHYTVSEKSKINPSTSKPQNETTPLLPIKKT